MKSTTNRTKCPRRTGWTGGLSEDELKVPGARLLQMILSKANDKGLQLKEVARKLGVTYGYIHQLRTGVKPIKGLSEQLIENIRIFLEVPKISVMLAAGIITQGDFYEEDDMYRIYLRQGFDFIMKDPVWGSLLPADIQDCNDELRVFIVKLYEKATGRVVLSQQRCVVPDSLENSLAVH